MTSNEGQTENDFPVEWADPADAELSWRFDTAHTPDVMTPLGFDLYYDPFIAGFGLGLTPRLVNCYVYTGWNATGPIGSEMPKVELEPLRQAAKNWQENIIPEVVGHIDYYRETDFDGRSDQELIEELDKLVEVRTRGGALHSQAMMPWLVCMNQLIDTYHDLTGGDDVSAMRLVQGYGNKSVEAGHELWKLSRLADSIPSVREQVSRVTRENVREVMDGIEKDAHAAPFREALSSFLDAYGWRSDLFELSKPTWAEDPTIPLCQMRAYLELENYDPAAEISRLAERRDEAIEKALSGLEGDDRTRLRDTIDVSAQLITVQEDHNFYIDQRLAYMPRRLVLATGRRLVSKGVLEDATDVFYLHLDELKSALTDALDGAGEIVGARKDDMAKWAAVTPPEFIGVEPEEEPTLIRRFQGNPHLQSDRPGELAGNSASGGVATGTARVLLSLSEADRLKPGDVLVARTTMPAWTPLFAVASAIVTESGGVLSHAAVVAREYDIPAVLSVKNATRIIRDGQLIEIDGDNGIVRMLG